MNLTSQNEPNTPQVSELEKSKKNHEYPTFIDLAAIYGVFAVTQLAGVLVAKIALSFLLSEAIAEFELASVMLLSQVIAMTLLIIFMTIFRRKRNAAKPPLKFSIRGFDPTILLGGFLMLLSVSVVIEPLLALLPPTPQIDARGWPMLVAVVIGAPIFEEIICRGFIFESLCAKRGVVVAWLLSSLFFGLMHMHPTMVINAFFMGLILCYIYIRSGSLLAPIILHALNNGLAYLLILLGFGDNVMLRDLVTNSNLYLIIYIVAALVLVASTLLCARQFKRIVTQKQEKETIADENIIEIDQ